MRLSGYNPLHRVIYNGYIPPHLRILNNMELSPGVVTTNPTVNHAVQVKNRRFGVSARLLTRIPQSLPAWYPPKDGYDLDRTDESHSKGLHLGHDQLTITYGSACPPGRS